MKNFIFRVCLAGAVLFMFQFGSAQTRTNTVLLKQASVQQAEKERILHERLLVLAKEKGWELFVKGKKGNIIATLVDVDDFGLPLYHVADNNIIAAATIGTNKLWPGGSTGLNLTGSSNNVKDKLAIWEAQSGRPRSTHVELAGRILQKDNPANVSDHATHVAGTMIASGVNPLAKGMSYGLQELVCYDDLNDNSEMMSEASNNLLVSNHSYGFPAGWNLNEAQNRWEFLGTSDANEDYKFGYYSSHAQLWDSIAYNAPYYLIVKSAGNNRDENGPDVGQPYWRYNSSGIMSDAGVRPSGISNNDSYDILSLHSTAKNILTVGAINPISSGYSRPGDVVMSSFSSWGPTDDGRIKPDIVADGIDVLSSIASSDNAYAFASGTSISSPNASGSLFLLQEYYSQLHSGAFMRSATLKGLAIHTADESGLTPGPDYQFGWGLLNMQKAAAVITANNTTHLIQENVLNNGGTLSIPVIASGNGTISATISWTDPKAQVEPAATALNNHTKKLVNDLDIVIKKGATTYRPWVLDPVIPSLPASRGDNTLDNVEKVELPDVIPGDAYTIEITHKGTLERGSQAYSLIASGVGGQAFCTSNPTSNAGARIDSVSFSNIRNKNTAGCKTYSSFTSLTGTLQPNQTLPFFIRLNSCDATSVDKIAKVYIDANNDGDFTDAGENIGTSGVINGNGDINNLNITVPAGLTPGKYTILRIVMVETSSASGINPCGTYTRGETQDYRIYISDPSVDVGISELTSPLAGECQTGQQYAAVRIKNFGTTSASNISVSVIVKQGTTTIATLSGAYTGTIPAGTDIEYTLQTPFALAANTAYSFTASTSMTGDQVSGNNQLVTPVTTSANAASPTGTANICGTTARLTATSSSSSPFNWYSSASATSALANGSPASTTTIQSTYYLSSGEVNGKLGPANKMVFTDGGYNQFGPGIRFTPSIPTTIKTARLYIGNSGKITFHLRQLVSFNETDGSYTYYAISSKTLNVTATSSTPGPGPQNNDPSDAGAIYNLGISIPEIGDYILAIEYADDATIFRNNLISGTNYPYIIPGIISMTGNTVVTPSPNFQAYYYYLYDIAVKPSIGCPSPRVAVVATTTPAPTISVAGNVLTSSAALAYQWFLNNVSINGAVNQSYTAVASGNYTVQTVDATNCTLTSAPTAFSITAVPNVDPSEIELTVSPNPSKGQFTIRLETRTKADMDISLMNTSGQRVYHSAIPDFIGKLTKTVEHNKMASGVYYLQIMHDKKMYIKKVVLIQ